MSFFDKWEDDFVMNDSLKKLNYKVHKKNLLINSNTVYNLSSYFGKINQASILSLGTYYKPHKKFH